MADLTSLTLGTATPKLLNVNTALTGSDIEITDGAGNGSNIFLDGTNVGIGINPTYPLHMSGSSIIPVNIVSTGATCGLSLKSDGTVSFAGIVVNDNKLHLYTENTARLTVNSTGVGIGTTAPTAKLQVAGSSYFNGIIRLGYTAKTISSGSINVTSTEGPFIGLAAESSTSDDLDEITIDGGTPPVGTTLFLTRVGGDTITLRTTYHTGFSGTTTNGFYASACDDFNEAETIITSLIIGSTYKHIQVVYNGRWSVIDPLITRCNTGE